MSMLSKIPGLKIVLVLALGFFFGWLAHPVPIVAPFANSTVRSDTEAVAHLMIDFGDGTIEAERTIHYSDGATVFSLTKDFTLRHNREFVYDPPGDWGVFVRQIGARKNGEQNRYWQYWVNHEQVQLAADRFQLKPNDVVEWKFIKTQ